MAWIEVCDVCNNRITEDGDGISFLFSETDDRIAWENKDHKIDRKHLHICNHCISKIIEYCRNYNDYNVAKEVFSSYDS